MANEQKYRVIRADGQVVSHIGGKLCECGMILPLSHEGPCPECGSTDLRESVIANIGDIIEEKTVRQPTGMGSEGTTD
ncbi:MAG: hypothetical protein HYV47_01185 [Candidatus Nealsonbacteria bacterium]|nr:hypothetical protein [Candidatus Nealsonbacteria bacterium]